ncbi:MAG: hypothetical protein AB7S38_07625 [Vulcanimicrobiota bacterium]
MTETYTISQVFGIWTAGFLTVCVFSFLYGDNPLYKFAEHVYVGVSAGYWMCLGYWQTIEPIIFERLLKFDWWALLPLGLGIMLLLRLFPQTAWVSRWPLAFLVGVYAGLNIVLTMQAQVLKQVEDTIVPLAGSELTWGQLVVNWILVVGFFTGLIYFYFSVEHKGWFFGGAARVGIWMLMIALGASFGYTVMARVSLLIGRVMFFKDEFLPATLHFFLRGGG